MGLYISRETKDGSEAPHEVVLIPVVPGNNISYIFSLT
jgi:hypothetical protein